MYYNSFEDMVNLKQSSNPSLRGPVVLGINFGLNDSGATLLIGKQLVASVEEERFNREKHTRAFPFHSIQYCLKQGGLDLSQVDLVAYYWNTQGRFLDRVRHHSSNLAAYMSRPDRIFKYLSGLFRGRADYNVSDMLFPKRTMQRHFPDSEHRYKLITLNHHHSHAACAYYQSGFQEAAVLVVDGSGEVEAVSLYRGHGAELEFVESQDLPHSLGVFYGAVTEFLGFKKFDAEYKVMGLAAYGKPIYLEQMKQILKYRGGMNFELLDEAFEFQYGSPTWFGKKFIDLFGQARLPDAPITEREENVAASAQAALEWVLVEIARYSLKKVGSKNLCMAGGVALNCCANGKIAEHVKPQGFFVHPASHDGGTSLGSALWALKSEYGLTLDEQQLPYLGPSYMDAEIESELKKNPQLKYHKSLEPEEELATRLSEGKVCCRFQGRMELGPRALGNRSILADPRDAKIRDEINVKVKLREEFRPFAPSCLEEDFDKYFEGVRDPFMVFTHRATDFAKENIPAVVHIDGTSRVQVVSEQLNAAYFKLLKAFKKKTGHGVLLNTSFNIQEPIVCSPSDALKTFSMSDMDVLSIGSYIVTHEGNTPT